MKHSVLSRLDFKKRRVLASEYYGVKDIIYDLKNNRGNVDNNHVTYSIKYYINGKEVRPYGDVYGKLFEVKQDIYGNIGEQIEKTGNLSGEFDYVFTLPAGGEKKEYTFAPGHTYFEDSEDYREMTTVLKYFGFIPRRNAKNREYVLTVKYDFRLEDKKLDNHELFESLQRSMPDILMYVLGLDTPRADYRKKDLEKIAFTLDKDKNDYKELFDACIDFIVSYKRKFPHVRSSSFVDPTYLLNMYKLLSRIKLGMPKEQVRDALENNPLFDKVGFDPIEGEYEGSDWKIRGPLDLYCLFDDNGRLRIAYF